MKEIPRPPCKNRTRTTLRCRRMCCRKPVNLDNGGGEQRKITTNPNVWFSPSDLKAWRQSRKSRGYSKSGRK